MRSLFKKKKKVKFPAMKVMKPTRKKKKFYKELMKESC